MTGIVDYALARAARVMQATKAYLPIRGSQVYYETYGNGEPVLLLHGGFGTVEDFASQTPELAKHFKVVARAFRQTCSHGHLLRFILHSGHTRTFS
jgi:hypothetical protein